MPATPSTDPQTNWALGASLALFAAALTGIALGWLVGTRAVGGVYITFVMPLLVGSLIGGAAALPARRFGLSEKRPLVAAVLLGALICFVGHHVFAFLSVAERLALQNPAEIMVYDISDPVRAAILHLENATGEEGYFAYLAFTAKMPYAQASPIGLLGRVELSIGMTILIAGVELLLLSGAAVASVLWRTRHLRVARGSELPFALVDEVRLLDFARALQERALDRAAAALRPACDAPSLALFWRPGRAGFEVWELDPSGVPTRRRAENTLTAKEGEALARLLDSAPDLDAHTETDDARP